jgi:hypothetical protein
MIFIFLSITEQSRNGNGGHHVLWLFMRAREKVAVYTERIYKELGTKE